VCARVLYGLSSTAIALDLDVGEETVKTYRKRAYQRLAIGSERELLNWYLAQWSRWSAGQPDRLH
jgi:DNA-binding CsgD family transcriptional regulator